jgi:hypothetical protein
MELRGHLLELLLLRLSLLHQPRHLRALVTTTPITNKSRGPSSTFSNRCS